MKSCKKSTSNKGEFNMQKRALTPEGVSEIYQIPRGTLANLRSQKRGARYYKVGRRVIYFIEDVESWLKAEPVLTQNSLEEKRGR